MEGNMRELTDLTMRMAENLSRIEEYNQMDTSRLQDRSTIVEELGGTKILFHNFKLKAL